MFSALLIELLWKIVWIIIPVLLSVSKEVVINVLKWVNEAQEKTHEDGTGYSGAEKRQYVIEQLENQLFKLYCETPTRVVDALIDLAVNYAKRTTSV